jgi:hypothetical protein
MKRIMLALMAIVACAALAHAGDRNIPATNQCIFHSSFTKTNDTAQYIPDSMYLKSVIVSSASAGGFAIVYGSTWTAVNQLLPAIDLGTVGTYEVDLYVPEGITYTTSGNTNGVAFIYRKKE